MKKKLMAIILSVCLLLSSVSVAIAVGTSGGGSDETGQAAVYTKTSPALDGDKDEAYAATTPVRIDIKPDGAVAGGGTATANAYLLLDAEYLYVLVDVADATPKYNEANDPILRDVEGVNFFIDFLNRDETDYIPGQREPVPGEQGRIQTNFIAKRTGDAVYTGGSGDLNSYVMTDGRAFTGEFGAVLKQSATGYRVELRVKLSASLKNRLATETNPKIGFGMQVNDDQNDSYEGDNSGRETVVYSDQGCDGEWYSWESAIAGSKGFPDVALKNTAPVTVGTITGGAVTPNVSSGIIGSTVTLTAAPDNGKRLKTVFVNGVPIVGLTFAIPAGGAVVTAEFVDKSGVVVPPADDKGIPNFTAGCGTAQLDGVKDAAYGAGQTVPVNIDYHNQIVTPDSGFASAEATTIFDSEYLYVFVEVTDPTPKYNEANNPIIRDVEGVNFFFDFLNNDEGDAAYGANSPVAGEQGRIQTSFIAKRTGDAEYDSYPYVMTDGRGFSGGFATKLVQTEKGYNVEMRVQLSSQLKNRLANEINPSIGVGVQLNDDTDDSYEGNNDGRDQVLFTFAGIDREWVCAELPYGGSRGFPNMVLLNGDMDFYTVTVDGAITGGTVVPDLQRAAPGSTVYLTVKPDSGMQLKAGSLKVNGEAVDNKYFTMPAGNVVVTAEFEASTSDNDPNAIKVVSQNILNDAVSYDYDHGNRRVTNTTRAARMGELIGNRIHPDSIGFQEVFGNGRGWAKLLHDNFPDYDYVGFGRDFEGSNDTIREDYAHDVSSGEATPIFYLRDKYDLVESGTWWISKTPGINPGGINNPADLDATWNAQYKMTCTWAVLKNKETGKMYAHINSHLDPGVELARTEGMKVVVRKVNDLAYAYGSDLPMVMTADWNCDQTSDAYEVMVSNDQVKVTDGAYCLPEDQLVNWGTSYHDFGQFSGVFAPPIDIAFITSDNARVTHYEILKQPVDAGDGSGEGCLSDHFGIFIKFVPGERSVTRPVPERRPGGTENLTAVYGSAAVDGVKDDAYSGSTAAQVDVGLGGAMVPAAQAQAVVSTIYDDNFLYCFAEVTDPSLCDKVAFSEPEQDDVSEGVAFFLDFLNTPESDERYQVAGEQGGIRIGYAALADRAIVTTERAATMPYTYAAVKTDKGYNIELRVQLSDSLKARVNRDEDVAIGIGFQVNDDVDNDGVRDAVCFSSASINYEWLPDEPEVGGCKGFQDILLISGNKPSGASSGGAQNPGASSSGDEDISDGGTPLAGGDENIPPNDTPRTGSAAGNVIWIATAALAAALATAGVVEYRKKKEAGREGE